MNGAPLWPHQDDGHTHTLPWAANPLACVPLWDVPAKGACGWLPGTPRNHPAAATVSGEALNTTPPFPMLSELQPGMPTCAHLQAVVSLPSSPQSTSQCPSRSSSKCRLCHRSLPLSLFLPLCGVWSLPVPLQWLHTFYSAVDLTARLFTLTGQSTYSLCFESSPHPHRAAYSRPARQAPTGTSLRGGR